VPTFQSGPNVAALMGDEPRRKPQQQEARREPRREPEKRQQHSAEKKQHSDPIFSKPYEPGTAPPQPKSETPEQPRRKQRQVAALLGGFKKA
jgi:hypothetical protein